MKRRGSRTLREACAVSDVMREVGGGRVGDSFSLLGTSVCRVSSSSSSLEPFVRSLSTLTPFSRWSESMPERTRLERGAVQIIFVSVDVKELPLWHFTRSFFFTWIFTRGWSFLGGIYSRRIITFSFHWSSTLLGNLIVIFVVVVNLQRDTDGKQLWETFELLNLFSSVCMCVFLLRSPCPRLCFAVWSCLCVSDRFVRLLGRLFRIRWKSEPFFCFFFLLRCRQKNFELLLCRIVSYWLVEGKPEKKKKKSSIQRTSNASAALTRETSENNLELFLLMSFSSSDLINLFRQNCCLVSCLNDESISFCPSIFRFGMFTTLIVNVSRNHCQTFKSILLCVCTTSVESLSDRFSFFVNGCSVCRCLHFCVFFLEKIISRNRKKT